MASTERTTRVPDRGTDRRGAIGPDPVVRRAMWAVAGVFTLNGFGFASWVSRIPSARDELGLQSGPLGLVLLGLSFGAVLSLPLAGVIVTRFGAAATVTVTSLLMAVGLVTVAVRTGIGVLPVVVGLFAMGLGQGSWDVAMNVEGAAVEQRLGRAIMPRFHAGFSVGTVVGALLGAGAAGAGLPVRTHLVIVAVVIAVLAPLAARAFLPSVAQGSPEAAEPAPAGAVGRAWREPRTLLIGLVVLAFAFSEGTGNDWLALATVDDYGQSQAVGSLVFAVFVAAMTVGRLVGTPLLDRLGRVVVLRGTAGVAVLGLLAVVLGSSLPFAVAGAALWGFGSSLGFPVGMSAAADDPARSAARVSVVASIGYTAFLAGPPLIGFLGQHVGIQRSLSVAAALLVIGFLVAASTRMLPGTTLGAGPAAD